ncbi:DNA cytosine methyltransferase [Minwuia sp. IMCC3009]|uniref:DNA cytosine methyltransferase n=1 Tax=Minwuia sp. IMCC3009 TaxID=3040674 RepID=UPI00247A7ADA|nr:DNA cytosine methyltransferase [Minwuia sp. IMCC3009]
MENSTILSGGTIIPKDTDHTDRYKVVSLFSGAMGLDLGLHHTGRFELKACVELVPAFCDTIRANQTAGKLPADLIVIEDDLTQLSAEAFMEQTGIRSGEVDVLVGGPPCQAFSTAGRRKGIEDPRGTLLWDYLRFIEALRPKFFLMENVRGLLSASLKHRPISNRPNKGGPPLSENEQPGSVIRMFAQDLQAIQGDPYHMDCFEVNAVNYGAPQLRERALFIGNRFGVEVDFPEPTHGIAKPNNDLFQQTGLEPWTTLGDALHGLNDPGKVGLDFSPRKKEFLSMVPPGSNWRSLPVEVQQESMGRAWHAKGGRSGWWRRLSMDLPCPTLVTMPNHASTSLCHPTETRALTAREYARIQGFPDDWKIEGRPSEQYAQLGNAVPVRLGEVAGRVIAAELDALRNADWKARATPPKAFRTVYIQAHVRTRQWFKAGKTFVWDDGGDNSDANYAPAKTVRKTKRMLESSS